MIHPTAIVDPGAEIGKNVRIGPYSIVADHVVIGDGTTIGPHVTIDPFVTIGPDCTIFQYTSIGALPQALKFEGEETYVKIGSATVIREFATINRGTGFGGGVTEIGDNNLLMAYTHIAHDCRTGNGVILANVATLAGHITLEDHVIIGGLTAIHQFVRVGQHAYVGGKSAVVRDIPPYVLASGDRARLHGLNRVGLKRHGYSEETIKCLKRLYRIVFRFGLTLNEAIERCKAEVELIPEVVRFIEFLQSSQRGVTR